jgi:TRAP-type C4-dicarboxylate transport system permease small subunit
MKFFAIFTFAILAISASAEWEEIDWSSVIPRTEVPGFWDGRAIRPAFYPGDQTRSGRIVGG